MSRPEKSPRRDVHGIVLLDKPVGISSNKALQQAKRIFNARKAGHTGSLDPLASGLLVICFGEATKISAYLLDADKRYEVTARLGIKTNSGDADGEVLREEAKVASRTEIEAVLPGFRGDIMQVPPMFSALKHKGQRLYQLARKGVEVDRAARKVTIDRLELTHFREPYLSLDVGCSKGTYVRTLVEEIAEAAGSCAHVTDLRRLQVGPFSGNKMMPLDRLEHLAGQGLTALDQTLLPIDSALSGWPAVNLGVDAAWYLQRGQAVAVPQRPAGGWVRLYGAESAFIGIGEVTPDGRIAPKRLFRLGNGCL